MTEHQIITLASEINMWLAEIGATFTITYPDAEKIADAIPAREPIPFDP